MSLQVRSAFEQHKQCVLAQPVGIREWVERMFSHSAPKTFLELGAHTGTDTAWMAALPNVSIHAFEPDPRNAQPPRPNLKLRRAAVGDHDGQAAFILSARGWGHEWTHSSSLRLPKHHLDVYPVTFGETIEVDTVTLDTYCREEDLQKIDFIWADIQGAEGDMIHGGSETLRRTRYLYTEYSDDELYEGQVTLRDILDMLPTFRVLELWPDHVLLENRSPE